MPVTARRINYVWRSASAIRYVLFDSYGLYLPRLLTWIVLSKLGFDGGVAQW